MATAESRIAFSVQYEVVDENGQVISTGTAVTAPIDYHGDPNDLEDMLDTLGEHRETDTPTEDQ